MCGPSLHFLHIHYHCTSLFMMTPYKIFIRIESEKKLLALISPDTPRTYHKWTRIWLEMVIREVKLEKSILGFRQKPTEWQKAVGVRFFSLPLALFCPASTNSFIIPRSWWVKGRFLQTETPSFFQFPNKGYIRKHVYCKDMNACFFSVQLHVLWHLCCSKGTNGMC